ncbi:hypothetical protein HBH56_101570 [Parastagonospora nodorum]|uniref:Uncharacterized protein n=1 Tax=Phaeosphaeria nodorum (strain SN15 / ATCC MYA-4574 / FGSC 10173) TaxID=321614 RepID=A0A7U2FJW0_PHANO|nr:hypothetical protein HBH56_101570 [Parastagonospora nodorum]QRD04451.1 hypothetical protein JI435_104180 [Parastagonospora nodorum SN15]KAH3929247.1 hypothetical protein HBH54_128860 [Parastagonospora nodorum]KAH4137796.1 hypothetical protein HBH45_116970 [Parastagonospora nodorum]KAH4172199.1 hypothetical protein HBH44_032010 [Parastagonospora nodorum]
MSEQYPYRTGTTASPGDDTEIACLYGQLNELAQQRDEAEDGAAELKGKLRAANVKIDRLEVRVDRSPRIRIREKASRMSRGLEEAARKDREAQAATRRLEKKVEELTKNLGGVRLASDAFQRQAEAPSAKPQQEQEHALGSRGSTVTARGAVKKRGVEDLVNLPSRPAKKYAAKKNLRRGEDMNGGVARAAEQRGGDKMEKEDDDDELL